MRGTLAVAAREIAERKLLFLGALVAGLLPLAFPLLPVLRGNSRDARSLAVLLVGSTIAVAFPIVFGATVLVGDVAQKRLAFYFSRPLPAASIWSGKLLGALSISIGCVLLATAPVFLVEGESAFSADTAGLFSRGTLLLALPGILLLFLLAHVVASMARLRSAWIALDFLFAVAFTAAIALSIRSLVFAGFWDLRERSRSVPLWWLPVALILILLAATCVQVVDGRTDARRSHGALSATLWGLTAFLTLPLAGLAWWVSSAGPKDLVSVEQGIQAAPRGSWVAVAGKVRNRGAAGAEFLYDTASERSVKLNRDREIAFSGDGGRAAWAEGRVGFFEREGKADLLVAELASAKRAETGLRCGVWCRAALSPSGRRLAVYEDGSLAAYEISDPSNPKQLAAIRMESSSRRFVFVGEDTVRVFPRIFNAATRKDLAPRDLEIEEISLLSKKSLVTGRLERDSLPNLRLGADGRYFVGTREKRLTLHDGRTGALVATLSEDVEAPKMRFLSGGRMAVAGVADGKGALKIFLEGEKTPPLHVELGAASTVVLGGEIAPGRVAVALNPFRSNDESSRRAWKLAFVDVTTGVVSPGPDGLVPADRFGWWFSPVMPPAEAGSPASKLFLDASGALVRLDPASGKQEILLGARR